MKRLLSARAVAALTAPGRYAVGHGAYLQISTPWRTKSWIFRYVRNGTAHYVGMGSCDYVTLAQARERAVEYRRMLARGEDPLEAKRAGVRAASAATPRTGNGSAALSCTFSPSLVTCGLATSTLRRY